MPDNDADDPEANETLTTELADTKTAEPETPLEPEHEAELEADLAAETEPDQAEPDDTESDEAVGDAGLLARRPGHARHFLPDLTKKLCGARFGHDRVRKLPSVTPAAPNS